MFSMTPSSRASTSLKFTMRAGMLSFPAVFDARQRRSPQTISYPPLVRGRTRMGCRTPCALMLSASSARAESSVRRRGFDFEGLIWSRRISWTGALTVSVWGVAATSTVAVLIRFLLLWKERLAVLRDHGQTRFGKG